MLIQYTYKLQYDYKIYIKVAMQFYNIDKEREILEKKHKKQKRVYQKTDLQ